MTKGSYDIKVGLAEMLKGGVIMDVTSPQQAKIAEEAGACAVMALERIPSDIRKDGGISRMSDPEMIKGIQSAVSIPSEITLPKVTFTRPLKSRNPLTMLSRSSDVDLMYSCPFCLA